MKISMKALFTIFFLTTITVAAFSQSQRLEAVTVYSSYHHHLKLASGAQLNAVDGFGAGLSLSFRINKFIAIGLEGGYSDLKIDQDDAVKNWDWGFWNRFYGNYVKDLQQRDPNYVATFTPNQRLYLISIHLFIETRIPRLSFFTPYLNFAGGVYFYERNLSMREEWKKYFPQIDYTFQYEFDNFANVRKGNVFGLRIGIGGTFSLSKYFEIDMNAKYHHISRLKDYGNYEHFPLKSWIEVGIGLKFLY